LAFWVGAILVKENKTTFGDVFKVHNIRLLSH
jgi:hypothetical protein